MICTSSYSQLGNHENGISISGDRGKKVNYTGPVFSALAPKKSWWERWNMLKDHMDYHESVVMYMDKYYETVLANLDPKEVYETLDGKILLCYEESEYFCHRHVVAEWLELCLDIHIPEVKMIDGELVEVQRPKYVKELLPIVINNYNSNNKKLSKTNDKNSPISY